MAVFRLFARSKKGKLAMFVLRASQILALMMLSCATSVQATVTTLDCPVASHVQLEPQASEGLPAPKYKYQFVFDSAGGAVDAKETNLGGGAMREEQWSGDASLTPSMVTINFRGRFTLYTFQINRSSLAWTGLSSMPGYFKRQMSGICKVSKASPRTNKF